jgi:iron complex outermembrane recepter protein
MFRSLAVAPIIVLLPCFVLAQTATPSTVTALQNLKALSIEELMTIDITTASRRETPVDRIAAAVSVITRDDIRRSGATTIADALLLADGVNVSRATNGTWAISPRGFNQTTANKLLVMVDGLTQYSPLYAGVFWNTLDYVLEDIERIEVIRGPGGVLWGANAVNGVVNIITRSARDTAGGFASLAAGTGANGITEFRYGGAPSGGSAWRAYGKFANRGAQQFASGNSSGDAIRRGQTGFRMDGGSPTATNWLIKGDLFHSADDFPTSDSGAFTTGGLQARWSRPLTATSRFTLQSYYRHEYRRVPLQLTHAINTVDVDALHLWELPRHEFVSGAGFRVNADTTEGGTLRFDPVDRTYRVGSVFAQDEFMVVPDRVFLTLGAKWEHNAFSGGEFQPNIRGRVRLPRNQMAWAAVSRAVRRPTRFEDDLIIPVPAGSNLPFPAGATVFQGSDDFESESLIAIEGGYRAQTFSFLSLDLAVFRHRVDELRSQEGPVSGVIPITFGNSLIGHVHGIEAAANVQPFGVWRTHLSYTLLDSSTERTPGSRDRGGASEANDPRHQFSLRSSVDLPAKVQLDAMLRSLSALPNPIVPAFTELSLRVGWLPTSRVEVWVVGQDLLHDHHPEFGSPLPTRVEFERSLRAGLALRF